MFATRTLKTVFALTTAFVLAGCMSAWAEDGHKISPQKEAELLAILRSDAPAADKAIACKKLAIDGSSAAVPEVAKLLPDPQLSSWARTTLEAVPGPEADEALRKAAETLQGRLLVGTINSIGVRRDVKAVEPLTTRLQDADAEVASAAAVALGKIGSEAAAQSLRAKLAINPVTVRSAVAEGCILCAEQLDKAGKSAAAAELYDEVRKADLPKQRKLEATRGAILARKQDGVPLLLEQFRSQDKSLFQLALSTAREFPQGAVDKALAGELAGTSPDRAALVIQLMAERPEAVVLPAIVNAAQHGPREVRIAAIAALGRVGDASSLPALLETAVNSEAELAEAAKASLVELRGEKVDAQLVTLLRDASGKQFPLLIGLVGQRRLVDATPTLIKALDHSDAAVRTAALAALGETVAQSELSVLISHVVKPSHPEDAAAAQLALKTASVRMPNREACAAELTAAMERASSLETKVALLEIVGAVGGKTALATVDAAANSSDEKLQDVGSRLLGGWSTDDAAPVLLALATKEPAAKFQTRALRGYIRIARQFVLPEAQRAEMCQKAFEAANQSAEQKMVLDVVKRYPSAETMNLAIKAMSIPEVKDEATAAALTVAQKLDAKGVDVNPALAKTGFEKVNLEIVKAEYGAQATHKDVTEVVKKQAGVLPLINLPGGYNASFGGDPMPGTAKQLKIQYKINGKQAEATFAENALVILPMPQ